MVILGNEQHEKLSEVIGKKRVGLLTNQTGTNGKFESTIEIYNRDYRLTALYTPEHGLFGSTPAGDPVFSYLDSSARIPVYSLYGDRKKPTPEMLKNIDILVCDLQDVGLRFYTYLYTMALAMEAMTEVEKPFVLLDRPNPLGGLVVDGMITEPEYFSFVGMYPIPQRYGLTMGELATWIQQKFLKGARLQVIPMQNWNREMLWVDTGLPWVMPSPNIPTFETLFPYAISVLIEGTNVSEGRGTSKPFSLIGAPWINGNQLARQLNVSKSSDHIFYRSTQFRPTCSKYQGELCEGVEIHILDYRSTKELSLEGFSLLYTIQELWPDKFHILQPNQKSNGPVLQQKRHPFITLLAGSDAPTNKSSLARIREQMVDDSLRFVQEKATFHIYS